MDSCFGLVRPHQHGIFLFFFFNFHCIILRKGEGGEGGGGRMTPLFFGEYGIFPRLLCLLTVISAFYHCKEKPTKCFKGGLSLPL